MEKINKILGVKYIFLKIYVKFILILYKNIYVKFKINMM